MRISAVDRFANTCQDFLLLHLGFYSCFASQNSATNGYERLIGLQTVVRSSSYQFCIFLPVYISTDVR
ncbi:hypothetical protein T07_2172 [Trichinella nelsoni]|nr:hypothetical protein T07_2172 [Trichinella nelsoni]